MEPKMEPTMEPRRRRTDRYKEEAPQEAVARRESPPAAPVEREAPPRPKALVREETPPAPMARPKPPQRPQVQRKITPRLPLWLAVTLISVLIVAALLVAGECMMRGYLAQRQQEREAAYQRVVEAHPIAYQELIERYAAENNLRPAFVAAIILNESSYRTDAESRVGARGLMQLMPDTAQWVADKLDVENYSFASMYDAETNIRFGTWYLGYLGNLFRGDPVLVACAFHAGQGEVTGWLSNPTLSQDGVTLPLENLMDGPTKTYAGRVTRDYGIYEALYFAGSEETLEEITLP